MKDTLLYWDTSAILSALFLDAHSEYAQRAAKGSGIHVYSSLAIAETFAVIARMERQGELAPVLAASSRETFLDGPWRFLVEIPGNQLLQDLAVKWPLRGADLWHLACAKTIAFDLPETKIITFDVRLQAAALSEGIAANLE